MLNILQSLGSNECRNLPNPKMNEVERNLLDEHSSGVV